MTTAALSARLKYLNQAAHAVALVAPVTSTSLSAEFNRLSRENVVNVAESHRRLTCGGCGNLFIPGRSCTVAVERAQPRAKRAPKQVKKPSTGVLAAIVQEASEKVLVYTCLRCPRRTRIALEAAHAPIRRRVGRSTNPITAAVPSSNQTTTTTLPAVFPRPLTNNAEARLPSSNATSKQRAKARKAGGLSSLLAKSKAAEVGSAGSGSGLNLLDFMKLG